MTYNDSLYITVAYRKCTICSEDLVYYITVQVNTGLHHLNVGWNGFAQEGCKALGTSLSRNSTLLSLNLTHNRIQDATLALLLRAFNRNTNLVTLKVSEIYSSL